MNEIECETIEIKIPKALLPLLECLKTVSGQDTKSLLTEMIRSELKSIFEQPYHIIDYLDQAKCAIFLEFEKGLEQWDVIKQEQEKDHTQEEKIYVHT